MIKRMMFLAAIMVCAAAVLAHAKKEWDELKGSNFIVYSRDVPEDFVNTVLEEAENDFRRVSENLGVVHYQSWAWDKRANIYIYPNEEDYVKNGGMGWSHGSALVQAKMIRTFPSDNGFFDSILPHELGHIILHEYVGPVADVPLWFDEGVAMYQEKARRLGAHAAVRKAIKNGQFIPLTQLAVMRLYNGTDKETVQLFYAESASVVNFMIAELGEAHFRKLCQGLKDRMRFEQALSAAYMRIDHLEELNKRWVAFLEGE